MKLTDDEIDSLAYEVLKVRDLISPMLNETYQGSYDVLKKIGDNQISTNARKPTLKEARKRIKKAVEILNKVANKMIP